ncbi:HepT-like ribonuclease domain-containing protein [Pseudonocardia nantongensis]|uniref:HepT-like ribonuclease domain-containing protein n=1 Tax=Pseudonocardia nantongensis TaxID=1181885 RepID=UPI003978BE25
MPRRCSGTSPGSVAGCRTIPHGVVDPDLAERLARAAAFRNLLVHAYGDLDLRRVHAIASEGPADLRAFLAALRDA